MRNVYEFVIRSHDGREWDLWELNGRVVMFTMLAGPGPVPQTVGLNQLVGMFGADGLAVVGVPVDAEAAVGHDGVAFDIAESIEAPQTGALMSWLLDELPGPFGTRVAQGFTKFLIGRDGRPVARFEAAGDAKELIRSLQAALAMSVPPPPDRPDRSSSAGLADPSAARRLPVPMPPRRPDDDIIDAEIVAESSTEIVVVTRVRSTSLTE